jgi:5'(3')-deoxyribonucleotidase
MTDKPQLALDFDSVLAATHRTASDLIGVDYDYEDVETWDWPLETFGRNRALSALWHAWTIRPQEIEPMEENLSEKVAALHSKYNVHIVTAHPDHQGISEGKQQWLDDHGIGHEDFVKVPMASTKAKLGYDVFIDDKPTLPERAGPDQTVYVRDHPYNRDIEGEHIRIESITDPLKYDVEI